jgi:hypothetical protein
MEQTTKREQPTKRRSFISRRWGTIIGIIVIAIAVIGTVQSGPHEVEHDTLFGEPPPPVVTVTKLSAQANLHQTYTYNGVHIVFTKAELAAKFSDDIKSTNNYVVRVSMSTTNQLNEAIGVDYVNLTWLILPNGEKIPGKLASISKAVYPGQAQSGYVDFPVANKVDLSQIKLQFSNSVLS